MGVDISNCKDEQTRPRFTTLDDSLLSVLKSDATKTSIGYITSLQGTLNSDVSGLLTAGFDHYRHPVDQFSTRVAFNTTGTIVTAPAQPVTVNRSTTNNTGYFGQV